MAGDYRVLPGITMAALALSGLAHMKSLERNDERILASDIFEGEKVERPHIDLGTVSEAAREVPVHARCEVLVVGGGPSGTAAAVAAARAGADVILLDLNFARGRTSGEEGFALLDRLMAADRHAVVIVVTGHSGIQVAVQAMRGFLLLGDKQLALAWTRLALQAAYNNARAMIALDRLMPSWREDEGCPLKTHVEDDHFYVMTAKTSFKVPGVASPSLRVFLPRFGACLASLAW